MLLLRPPAGGVRLGEGEGLRHAGTPGQAALEPLAGRPPFGLTVGLGAAGPAVILDGALPAEPATMMDGYRAAPAAAGGRLEVRLGAPVAGEIVIRCHHVSLLRVIDRFDDTASVTMEIPWQGAASRRFGVCAGAEIRAVTADPVADLRAERPVPAADRPGPGPAQPCDPEHAAAQARPPTPPDRPLSAIELFLRPVAPAAEAVLTLAHPAVSVRDAGAP